MVPNIGILEIAIVLVIALIVFGPKKLPDLGRSLGKGIREFRDGVSSIGDHVEEPPEESRTEGSDGSEVRQIDSGTPSGTAVEVEELPATDPVMTSGEEQPDRG